MISKRQQRLVNKSVSPEFEDVKAGGATAFMPFFFAQVTLPHKKTKCKYFKRGTSNLNLSIMEHPDYGIP